MLCRSCQIWELLATDQFCGWCGEKLIDFSVSIERNYLYAGDPISDLKLTIKHIGTIGEIELISASSDKSWLTLPNDQVEALAGALLHPGESIEIVLAVDIVDLPNDYIQAKITVDSSVGSRDIAVEVVSKPTIDKVSITGEHTILLDNVPDERLTGYLAISKGVVTITDIRTDVEWAQVYATNYEIPCTLDARKNKRLEFEFKIDEMRLLQEIQSEGGTFPADRAANLLMTFAYLGPDRNWPFYLKCLLPPELPEAEATIEVEAFAGKRAEFSLTLQNGLPGAPGHADLQIVSIDADIPCQPTMKIEYPLTVMSGQYQHLTFAVSIEKLELGVHHGKITLNTNIPGPKKQRDVFVEITVSQMPIFDGTVAIDFGTTNSCCAFIDHRGRQQLVPIDSSGNGNATASSAILYKNLLDDGNKDYEIGEYAYKVSFFGGRRARCTVTQVKRWLGKQKDYEIRFQDAPEKTAKYRPREVATDIFRRILQLAEDKLNARITTLTISHPCRFQIRQIEDLKSAVTACGIAEGDISLVPEPVGAALDFIRGEQIRTEYEEYHLMVFDFGGGTIDVTLMKVINETRPGRKVVYVKPNVLGIAGDEHFGGEDITESVLQLIHEKCEEEVQARNPTATPVIVPINERSFSDPRHKVLARLNRNRLRQRAEATKIAIASFGEDYLKQLDQILTAGITSGRRSENVVEGSSLRTVLSDTFTLAAIVGDKIDETYNFTHQHVAPQKEQVDAVLIPKLSEIIASMRSLAEKKGVSSPEVVLLSGKSSNFPVVRELMSKAFPEAKIEMPTELKECVVRGACQIADEDPREGVAVRMEGGHTLNVMTSSLGISVTRSQGGRRFKPVIDNGEPIGKEGIRKAIDLSRTDFTRRTRITIYENTGSNDHLVDSSGKDNPNITPLKTFRLESKLSQWERENDIQIQETDLDEASIELEVAANLRVKLIATIPRIGQSFEFDADYLGA